MKQLQLLADRRFWPLFWTQFLGAFNDCFLKNAMVLLITYQGVHLMGLDHQQMSVFAGALFILPFFLFSATAGQLADKFDKARLARIIKAVEVGLMGLASLGFWMLWRGVGGQSGMWLLLGALFLMGVHATFFGPIKYSILPQLLGQEARLVGGNALVEMATNIAILMGTLLGGELISLEPHGPLVVSACLLTVATLGLLASRHIPSCPSGSPDLRVEVNPVTPTWDILKFVRPQRAVFLSILGNSWFWLYGSAFLSLLPAYARDTLGCDHHVVTLFLAVFSVGVGAGSLLCEKFSFDRLELGLVPFGSIGMTVFGFDLFLAGVPTAGPGSPQDPLALHDFLQLFASWRITVDLLMMAMFSGLFIVPLYTLIQQRSELSHRSRVIAANNIVNSIFMVAQAAGVMALLRQGWSIPAIFGLLAVLNAVVAIYIYTLLPEFFLRFLVYLAAHLCYRMRTTGLENIPREGPAVLVANHVTFVDWFLIAADIQRPVRFVMDVMYYRMPVVNAVFRDGKCIPIASARRDPQVLEQAYDRIAEELEAGELVCLFPEGAVTRDGLIAPFRPGIEKILERTPVPVVPMALFGLWGSFFSKKGGRPFSRWRGFRNRVRLQIGPPLPPQQASAEHLQSVVQELHDRAAADSRTPGLAAAVKSQPSGGSSQGPGAMAAETPSRPGSPLAPADVPPTASSDASAG